MAQKLVRVTFAVLFAAGALVVVGGGATTAQDKKAPTIKEIMKAGHAGADAFLGKTGAAVKGGKWEDAAKAAKALDDNAALLEKATPKKGEAASWAELTKKYHGNTTALVEAVGKKDADAAKTSIGALQSSCKECHTAHKGK
jgi:cytochrome c556